MVRLTNLAGPQTSGECWDDLSTQDQAEGRMKHGSWPHGTCAHKHESTAAHTHTGSTSEAGSARADTARDGRNGLSEREVQQQGAADGEGRVVLAIACPGP